MMELIKSAISRGYPDVLALISTTEGITAYQINLEFLQCITHFRFWNALRDANDWTEQKMIEIRDSFFKIIFAEGEFGGLSKGVDFIRNNLLKK